MSTGAAVEDAIAASSHPLLCRSAIEQITDAHPTAAARLEDPQVATRLVAVTAASRSLSRLLRADTEALGVLVDVDERAEPDASDPDALVRWKQRELLRIAARDLTGIDTLEETGRGLARLAADVLEAACSLAPAPAVAVIAMGKAGAAELNYSSDVDVMFVGDGPPEEITRQARATLDVAQRCFRVDANLRPEGAAGALVRNLDAYEAWWDRHAQPWEFQALLKAQSVAGSPALGRAFDQAAAARVWERPFSADDVRSVRAMKQRAEAQVERQGLSDRELKLGRGGIRDIEFAVQLLQLVHGRLDVNLRARDTLRALGQLGAAGYIGGSDADALADAYRFLRKVEHRLQLVEEQQVHAVPADPASRADLARVLGYRGSPGAGEVEQFDGDLRSHQAVVRSIHERLYFRPLLGAFATADSPLEPEAAEARLSAFGFTDVDRTREAVRELTRGLTRSSRLMQQLLPLLLDWLSAAPDPDLGLLGLRQLASGPDRAGRLASVFRDSPEVAQRLCQIVGTSPLLTEILAHNPDLIVRLPAAEQLETRPREELIDSAEQALGWRETGRARQVGLQRWRERNLLGIAARDTLGFSDVARVATDLTSLADATLEAALRALEPDLPFAAVALGRFGGEELSYASDLDVVFVFDGADDFPTAERLATQLLKFVSGPTPSERIYDLDADLRPEGKHGPLARSLNGWATYYDRWAQTWERQAMVKARPVAGDLALGRALVDLVGRHVWSGGLTEEEVREIRRMKARVEKERIPRGEDPEFHLKLGPGSLSDVEWTAQLLQLRHGVRATGTMRALSRLETEDHLRGEDAAVLAEAYRFCERTRNRRYLLDTHGGDALPQDGEGLARLARALGTDAQSLRDEYRRVTRRSRAVVDRVFYER